MNIPEPISRPTFEELMKLWGKSYLTREIYWVYIPARTDAWWRYEQLKKTPEVWDTVCPKTPRPVFIDLIADPVECRDDVLRLMSDRKADGLVVVAGGEVLIGKENRSIITGLLEAQRMGQAITILSDRPYDAASRAFFLKYRELAKQQLIAPAYTTLDAEAFLQHTQADWRISLPKKDQSRLIHWYGGMLGMIRQTIRVWMDEGRLPDAPLSHAAIFNRMEDYWKIFGQETQELLIELVRGGDVQTTHPELSDHLCESGVIRRSGNFLSVSVNMLEEHVRRYKINVDRVSFANGRVVVNTIDVTYCFSDLERQLLKVFCSRKSGELVTRSELGEGLWPDEGGFTDWALDRLISRTKRKWQKYAHAPWILTTKKGLGYVRKY